MQTFEKEKKDNIKVNIGDTECANMWSNDMLQESI
jgi:hypothetical protein